MSASWTQIQSEHNLCILIVDDRQNTMVNVIIYRILSKIVGECRYIVFFFLGNVNIYQKCRWTVSTLTNCSHSPQHTYKCIISVFAVHRTPLTAEHNYYTPLHHTESLYADRIAILFATDAGSMYSIEYAQIRRVECIRDV